MKKMYILPLLLGMALFSHTLFAGENDDASVSFWEKLRAKIEQIVPQKKVAATTAVGGVRGAKMAVDDVYWKGEKVARNVAVDELEAFKRAIALAAAGDSTKAEAAFVEFVAANPDSALRKDADEALAQLQASK